MDALPPVDRVHLTAQLVRHEGLRLKLYTDPAGKPTIGVGRNLASTGISQAEAFTLLDDDIDRVSRGLAGWYPAWFPALDAVRQSVVINLAFNVGLSGFGDFVKLIAALQAQDYTTAAHEMLASTWAQQVGARATELATQMQTGQWAA